MTMKVKDVMGSVAITVPLDATFTMLVDTMRRFAVGAVTVVDADRRPVGIVSTEDALLKEIHPQSDRGALFESRRRRDEKRKAAGTTAQELMTSPAITVTEGTSVREAARLMHTQHIKQLPVINVMTGRVAGTVHQKDLLKVYARPAADIERDVWQVIEDSNVAGEGLGVAVEGGVVTLMGQTPLRSEAARLATSAEAVDGVVEVVDDLSFTRDDQAYVPSVYF
ncbi:CBS domain-containing protein [Sphaerisporangium sp. TRM90804]|uniref:CBS domain-containing protein n=1 Tax=Sphaerisporangium sp. TRM90804 TaxID=3031113 RepID=UPI002447D1F6|nr:CBS domain-containing protein [Sphaerisporangium sp. TRM90804]MDH2430616.1 CBS domain-containing protein [Sphaerisporangium sp. TRM90804]